MLPSQQSADMGYQNFSNSDQQQDNPIIGNGNTADMVHRYIFDPAKEQRIATIGNGNTVNIRQRRQLDRAEIERQRRQRMSSLYASLRSLLPVEYIKGKPLLPDHLNGAVEYIKHLQKKIEDLDVKRHELELKRESNMVALGSLTEFSNQRFIIRPCLNGFEIMFRCGFDSEDTGFSLSKVLARLVDDGRLSVVSCVSARSDEFLHHTIQVEVSNPTELPSEDKLTNEGKVAWFFAAINFILEIPSLAFDQLMSKRHPYYALTLMLISAFTLMICIFELIWKGRRGRYRWEGKGRYGMPWFYCSRTNKALGTLWDFIGFASAVSQLIIITIDYSFIRRRLDGPIKVSILPLILAFGLLCCRFLEQSKGRNCTAQHGAKTIALDEIRVG